MTLLPVDDALAQILQGVVPGGAETVSVYDAHNRYLAESVTARLTQPPFDASAMDGYAVAAAAVTAPGARLAIAGTSAAGHAFGGTVARGDAVRIFTGAPLPPGTDTVVIQEDTDRDGDTVILREKPRQGANVRLAGIDFRAGDTLLEAGTRLSAPALTLAAAMGYGELRVIRKPVVAILATGDELVPPGESPGPDQIVSSNPVGLASLVTEAGGTPRLLGIARDTPDDLAAKIREAKDADILVTIGGASVGDHDLVAPVLQSLGLDLAFWKVAIRPGKPLMFGHLGQTRVLGLPGNPVSALICAGVFLRPLIRALLGATRADPERLTARLAHALESNGPRLHLMRARHEVTPSGLRVSAMPSQDSSLLSALAGATCLIRRAPGAAPADVGDEVEIELLTFD